MRLTHFGIGALSGALLGSAAFLGVAGVASPVGSGVTVDHAVNGGGSSSFSISTSNPGEIIVIAADGFPEATRSPASPTVTVDGNGATELYIDQVVGTNTGFSSAWVYTAPTAGSHAIAVDESGVDPGYDNNMAVSLIDGTTSAVTFSDTSGTTEPSVSAPAGAYVLDNAEFNTGASTIGTFSWSGSPVVPTTLTSVHTGRGTDSVFGGERTAGTGAYRAFASDSNLGISSQQTQGMIVIPLVPGPCTHTGNNYSGANCVANDLSGAQLFNANFSWSNLSYANLSGANLINANLTGANLTGADLDGATMFNANVSGVTWSNTICPDGSNSSTNTSDTCIGHGA